MTTQAEPKKLQPPPAPPPRQLSVTVNVNNPPGSYAGLMSLCREGKSAVLRISAGPYNIFVKCESVAEVFAEVDPRAGDRPFMTEDGRSRSY